MNHAHLVGTVIAVIAFAVVAASISTPVPGAATPDVVGNRSLPDDGGRPTDGQTPTLDRPTFTLPGIGVTIPIAFDLPPWLGATLVIGLIAAMGVAIVRELRDRPTNTTVDPVTPDEVADHPSAQHGVGDAAGRAADRLLADTDAAVTNEVYRAWREMTRVLDVSRPASSTPQEFAAAAIDAGLDPADVETLTDLFERVRYGDERVTGDRAETVATILRGIEAQYTPEPEDEAGEDTDDRSTSQIPDPWETEK